MLSMCRKRRQSTTRCITDVEMATAPNERLHADFCGPIAGYMYFVIVDSYSKWIDIREMLDISAESTILSGIFWNVGNFLDVNY